FQFSCLSGVSFAAANLCKFNSYVESQGLPQAAKKLNLKKGQPCKQFLKGNVLVTVFYDKRQIAHLSTGCQPGIVVNSAKHIDNDDYNKHMGGVDLCDQHKSYYAVGRKARKW